MEKKKSSSSMRWVSIFQLVCELLKTYNPDRAKGGGMAFCA